jgi:catechol 2,3-dioxygenase-like lactoylglutathione lyase family enzyme
MMNALITQIDHCTVIITDISRSRAFYGHVLGLKEIPAPKEFDFVALWYDLGGQYLHLLQKTAPDTVSPRHFCLRVSDAKMARSRLESQGIPIEETTPIAAADRFFIHDPDGNRIEILQWLQPYDPDQHGAYRV